MATTQYILDGIQSIGNNNHDDGPFSSGNYHARHICANTWVPLNPNLASRYYKTYHENWIIRACYDEKIRAGFVGGFDIHYGPNDNKSSMSTINKKKSRKNNDNNKRISSDFLKYTGLSKGSSSTENKSKISMKEEMKWISDIMKRGEAYRDMLGMVAFRKLMTPNGSIRFEVIDLPYGYFVGKVDEFGHTEYGFKFYDSSSYNGMKIHTSHTKYNSAYNMSGSSNFFGGGATQHEPDSDVFVYTWSGLEPIIGSQSPFKSVMSVLYLNALTVSEMMQNELEGHFKMTHPIFVSELTIQPGGPQNMTEHDLLLDVAGKLGSNSSLSSHERIRMNAEISQAISNNIRVKNEKESTKSNRRLGLKMDNTETVHTRLSSCQDNMFISPIGTKVSKGPDAKVRTDIISMLQFKAIEVTTVMGVIVPSISGKSGGGGGSGRTKLGSRSDTSSFRTKLVEMRESMEQFFSEGYMTIIGKAENYILANMLTNLQDGKSNEESMVRSYVKNVLKRGHTDDPGDRPHIPSTIGGTGSNNEDGSIDFGISAIDPSGGNMNKKNKKDKRSKKSTNNSDQDGQPTDSYGAITIEEIESYKQKQYEKNIDKAQQQRRATNRLIYGSKNGSLGDPSVVGDGSVPEIHLIKRPEDPFGEKSSGQPLSIHENRSFTAQKLLRVDDPHNAFGESNTELLPSIAEWAGKDGPIDAKYFEPMDRFEREIMDFKDNQTYLDKIETAKWHRFMQDKNVMERRVSRIMYTALSNYGVTMNPELIKKALEKEIKKDPTLSNTFGADSTQANKIAENYIVDEIISQRSSYLEDLLDSSRRIHIEWNSAPLPDIELLILAGEKGLGIPPLMIGDIIASEMGLSSKLEEYREKQKAHDKELEDFLKRNKPLTLPPAKSDAAPTTKKKTVSPKNSAEKRKRTEPQKKKSTTDGQKKKKKEMGK